MAGCQKQLSRYINSTDMDYHGYVGAVRWFPHRLINMAAARPQQQQGWARSTVNTFL